MGSEMCIRDRQGRERRQQQHHQQQHHQQQQQQQLQQQQLQQQQHGSDRSGAGSGALLPADNGTPFFVGPVGQDGGAAIDASLWAVAAGPLLDSTVRQRTQFIVQQAGARGVAGFAPGVPLRPAIWGTPQHDGLALLEERWQASLSAGISGRRRSRPEFDDDDDSQQPAWMLRSPPRQHPRERAAAPATSSQEQQQLLSGSHRPWWRHLPAAAPAPEAASEPKPPWAKAWLAVHRAGAPREQRFIAWQLLHGQLGCGAFTAHVQRSRSPQDRPCATCMLEQCAATGELDTISHALLHCPASAAVMGWLASLWAAITGGGPPPMTAAVLLTGDLQQWEPGRELRPLWMALRLATIYYIWRARLRARAGGTRPSAAAIAARVVAFLRRRIAQDIMRLDSRCTEHALLCGDWVPERAPLPEFEFDRVWCHRGVLCRRRDTGCGYDICITTSHPVQLP